VGVRPIAAQLYERQIGEEREAARYPDEEAEELALIYNARGVPMEEARARAASSGSREGARRPRARELGLNPDDLGSPWRASIWSFAASRRARSCRSSPSSSAGARTASPRGRSRAFPVHRRRAAQPVLGPKRPARRGADVAIGAGAGAATYGIGHALHLDLRSACPPSSSHPGSVTFR
jgi:VIT1/CCC1 family predicted Fe2+/Mn2+ transporter